MSVDRRIAEAGRRLAAAGVPEAARDARLIARWALGLDATGLLREGARAMTPAEAARFEGAVDARSARRPLSQITGSRVFWGRAFRVSGDVLDPRPETESLVAAALALADTLPEAPRLVDLGTGSGCILLTLLAEWPRATGLGTDVSPSALDIARQNAADLGLAPRARFAEGAWWVAAGGAADLVVSNPPYVTAAEWCDLAPEVRLHEPRGALVPAPDPAGDGLAAYRAILSGAPSHLAPGGAILLEIGPAQGAGVTALAAGAGLSDIRVLPDLDGRDRVVLARRSSVRT